MRRKGDTNHPTAALARTHKAELVTGDPEFKAVEKEIKVKFLV